MPAPLNNFGLSTACSFLAPLRPDGLAGLRPTDPTAPAASANVPAVDAMEETARTAAALAEHLLLLADGTRTPLTREQAEQDAKQIAGCVGQGRINLSLLRAEHNTSVMSMDMHAWGLLDGLSRRIGGTAVREIFLSCSLTRYFHEANRNRVIRLIASLGGLPELREVSLRIPNDARGFFEVGVLRHAKVEKVMVLMPKWNADWGIRTNRSVPVEAMSKAGIPPQRGVEVLDLNDGSVKFVELAGANAQSNPHEWGVPSANPMPDARRQREDDLIQRVSDLMEQRSRGPDSKTRFTDQTRPKFARAVLFESVDLQGTLNLACSGDEAVEVVRVAPELFRALSLAAQITGRPMLRVKFSPNLTREFLGSHTWGVPPYAYKVQALLESLRQVPTLQSVEFTVPSHGSICIDATCLQALGLRSIDIGLPKVYGHGDISVILPADCNLSQTNPKGVAPNGGIWIRRADGSLQQVLVYKMQAATPSYDAYADAPGMPGSPDTPSTHSFHSVHSSPYSDSFSSLPSSPFASAWFAPATPVASEGSPALRSPLLEDPLWSQAGPDTDWKSPPSVSTSLVGSPVISADGAGDVVLLHTQADRHAFENLPAPLLTWVSSDSPVLDLADEHLYAALSSLTAEQSIDLDAAAPQARTVKLPAEHVRNLVKPKKDFGNMKDKPAPAITHIPGPKDLHGVSCLEVDASQLQDMTGLALDLRGFAGSSGLETTVAIKLSADIVSCDVHLDANVRPVLLGVDDKTLDRVQLFFWNGNTVTGPDHVKPPL
jgi:hypothetical protein